MNIAYVNWNQLSVIFIGLLIPIGNTVLQLQINRIKHSNNKTTFYNLRFYNISIGLYFAITILYNMYFQKQKF